MKSNGIKMVITAKEKLEVIRFEVLRAVRI
jgi:hypothetical protein